MPSVAIWSWVKRLYSSSVSVRTPSCKQQKPTVAHLIRKGSHEKQTGSSEFLGWCGARLRDCPPRTVPQIRPQDWCAAAITIGHRPCNWYYVHSWHWMLPMEPQSLLPLETKYSITDVPPHQNRRQQELSFALSQSLGKTLWLVEPKSTCPKPSHQIGWKNMNLCVQLLYEKRFCLIRLGIPSGRREVQSLGIQKEWQLNEICTAPVSWVSPHPTLASLMD